MVHPNSTKLLSFATCRNHKKVYAATRAIAMKGGTMRSENDYSKIWEIAYVPNLLQFGARQKYFRQALNKLLKMNEWHEIDLVRITRVNKHDEKWWCDNGWRWQACVWPVCVRATLKCCIRNGTDTIGCKLQNPATTTEEASEPNDWKLKLQRCHKLTGTKLCSVKIQWREGIGKGAILLPEQCSSS